MVVFLIHSMNVMLRTSLGTQRMQVENEEVNVITIVNENVTVGDIILGHKSDLQ